MDRNDSIDSTPRGRGGSTLNGFFSNWADSIDAVGLGWTVQPLRSFLSMPRWLIAVLVLLLLGSVIPFGVVGEVPEAMDIGRHPSRWVDDTVEYMVINWDPFFRTINIILLRYLLLPLERWLLLVPWWVTTVAVVAIAYKIVGRSFGATAFAFMLILAVLGLWDLAMSTLALVMVSALLAVLAGIPTGVLAAKSDKFDAALRPILDTMQTMPSFVYLIPVLMLFGLGKVPAVIATLIYAVPPIIRLTDLGIRQVDFDVYEAAQSFGSTGKQLLFKVQIPLAMPTIMAGLNQTIMMSLAMVVIASMIGAKGLGVEVLNGIQRLEVGRGLMGGIGIVLMAIILDRITQGMAKTR